MRAEAVDLPVERRERILAAAGELFCEREYAAVSLVGVAERAKVARGTVYNQFGSKEALYREVIAARLGRLLERLDEVLGSEGDPYLDLERCVVQPLMFFVKYPGVLLLWRRAGLHRRAGVDGGARGGEGALRDRVERVHERMLDLVTRAIADGVRRGVFRPVDSRSVAGAVLGAVEGAAASLNGRGVRSAAVLRAREQLCEMIRSGLRAEPREEDPA
ncbi:MAG: TetR/AcrR family transcriptional regulator [Polyangia bacterium]